MTRPRPKSRQQIDQSPARRGLWWRAAIIAAAGAAAYANSLAGVFLSDDYLSIVNNATIRDWTRASQVLFPARESPVAGRPLVNLSFALNYAAGGLSTRGYHIVNIAIHIACALLVFGILRRTFELPRLRAFFGRDAANAAFAVSLIWLVHPLNTEAVDYLTERTESLMAFFYLATLYAAIRGSESRGFFWPVLSVGACALGMACKESMVTAPLMVVLYEAVFVFDSARDALRKRWRLYAGLMLTWLVLAVLLASGPRMYSAGFSTRVHPWTYLLNQAVMLAHYLRLAIWPKGLVLYYGPPVALTLGAVVPQALFATVLLVAAVVAFIRWPPIGFLFVWVFVTLAPTSSIVPIATEVGAERRMYLPLIALVVLVVVGIMWAWRQFQPFVPSIAGAAVLVALAVPLAAATVERNREYRSGRGMASTVVDRWPTGFAHYMLGTELASDGHREDATREFVLAADSYPRARYNLGSDMFTKGRLDDAITELQAFIRAEPLLAEVIPAHLKIGQARSMQGRWQQAVDEFQLVLTMTPSNMDAQVLLAEALAGEKAFEEAIPHYRQYLAAHPEDVGALTGLGIALSMTEKHDDEALAAFRRAAQIAPQDARVRDNLARQLAIVAGPR